ncbi:MAG: hypothetical protein K2P93_00295 [Alphaproteobacteria bacterium]|nr:hypothetical protein [Alphaproteobacteria bacterium]
MKIPALNQSMVVYGEENVCTPKDAEVSLIRKEFVELTGDHFSAVILNQLLYWTLRIKDFDLFLEEERVLASHIIKNERSSEQERDFSHGWIYKTAHDLIEETMLGVSHPTMRKYLKLLVDQGWINERPHPLDKWKKTIQYRINVRRLQEDLIAIGRHLPTIYSTAFSPLLEEHTHKPQKAIPFNETVGVTKSVSTQNPDFLHSTIENLDPNVRNLLSNVSSFHSNENPGECFLKNPHQTEEISNVKILQSNAENLPSSVNTFHSDVSSFHPNVSHLHSYTYTENTAENTNREHTQRTRAREVDQKNVFEEVLRIWNTCLSQEGVAAAHLTDERRRRIHSLLPLYFENDLSQWERFCERVGRSPFLMGQGPRKWRVSLDWILVEENLLKVLEGNFDDGNLADQNSEKVSENVRNEEINTVLSSIEDPVWRELCSQLDFSHSSRDPVSLGELQAITHARFLEVEDDRLVWIGSSDAQVLSHIEDLRLKLLSPIKRAFPKVRNLRTRLDEKDSSSQSTIPDPHMISTASIQHKAEIHYAQ